MRAVPFSFDKVPEKPSDWWEKEDDDENNDTGYKNSDHGGERGIMAVVEIAAATKDQMAEMEETMAATIASAMTACSLHFSRFFCAR